MAGNPSDVTIALTTFAGFGALASWSRTRRSRSRHAGSVEKEQRSRTARCAGVRFASGTCRRPSTREARGHEGLGVVGLELVARDLEPGETVVGHVLVQGADEEVAIVVGMGTVVVLLVAVTLGVARQVEPVPGPALPIGGRGQQPVDQ